MCFGNSRNSDSLLTEFEIKTHINRICSSGYFFFGGGVVITEDVLIKDLKMNGEIDFLLFPYAGIEKAEMPGYTYCLEKQRLTINISV